MQRKPRQDPVSCQLCRSKKLKCSRQYPCSNCVARGVTCSLASSISAHPPTKQPPRDLTSADVLTRLERLEAVVLREGTNDLKRKLEISNETQHQSLPTPATSTDITDPEERVRDDATRELEDVGTRDNTLVSLSQGLLAVSSSVAWSSFDGKIKIAQPFHL